MYERDPNNPINTLYPDTRSRGSIIGAPRVIDWVEGTAFDKEAARQVVEKHNQWLSTKTFLELEIIEAEGNLDKKAYYLEGAKEDLECAQDGLKLAQEEFDEALSNLQELEEKLKLRKEEKNG